MSQCVNCVKQIINAGVGYRNSRRMAALKFNGWRPNDQILNSWDPSVCKGIESIMYGSIGRERLKWGGTDSLYPQYVDDYKWFEQDGTYAIKHFCGSGNTADLKDVVFYLLVQNMYQETIPKVDKNHPRYSGTWLNWRRPALTTTAYNEIPPWSKFNTIMSEVTTIGYTGTSTVWVPASGGVAGHWKPTIDGWEKVVWYAENGVYYTSVPETITQNYDDRASYLAAWASEGYLEWNATPQNWNPYDLKWRFKETGTEIKSDANINSDYNYQTTYSGVTNVVCREEDVGPYDFPNSHPFQDKGEGTAWNPAHGYCFNYNRQKIKISVYAHTRDTVHTCYYADNNYELSIGYKSGTCEMTYDAPYGDSYVKVNYTDSGNETFTVRIPDTQGIETHLVKVIEWDLPLGECRKINDFKLNSITDA